ncbi:hypothetical protein EG328_003355 [Venturia inaequalis]|uniref:Uncharacterized protein n=1 Tax=Venturia inaequalis TaxID=5025 RepID=A0A8H3VD70_VENIN|nr:hypothetical protein EG327_004665 [Venturia inaequalis]KAE9989038.1 hypothetical protein EG328_003355 [Venturia inaequalis]RDI76452.1 hypothetical protein Vi05172_g13547 [Venturia inaequalis]
MLFFLLFSTLVISKPITQSSQSLSLRTSLGEVSSQAQSPEACAQGVRTLVIDAARRTQSLQWNIGSIEAASTPVQCETTTSTDYNPQWQYAVTEINWHAYANVPQGSSATTGVSFGFGQGGSLLPAALNWLITGPYDNTWDQRFRVPVASQEWTPCGTVAPLTFRWSVKITQAKKSLTSFFQPPAQLGKTTTAGGNLTLAITTEFRECKRAL